ncbi:LytTR family DNA-binding domain-containing protein [bacterium]|nr:LytTR family DNA-binding domain-containing protein [bacterium]MCI0606583.1 LytTR family DNA-binding domain-containing protein [bacterium]
MIRVIVAEDEPLARSRIVRMLTADPEICIVAECTSGLSTLEAIRKKKPDLIFLDVQMPEMSGFEVLEALEDYEIPHVIFVTAFEKYALRAFELYALDYLLKPFNEARLLKALTRARKEMEKTKEGQIHQKLATLLEEFRARPKQINRVLIKEESRAWFLKVEEIDWIQAEAKYIRIRSGKRAYLVRRSLIQMEADLDPTLFIRVHRSVIVNLDRIHEIQTLSSGETKIKMQDGTCWTVSRSYRKNLRTIS